MTLKDAARLVAWAAANFPHLQERDMRPTAELWAKMLVDIPCELAEKALIRVLATAKYFPTVAEIREAAVELAAPEIPSANDAWGEVMRAVRKYGYFREAEALQALSPITRRVVENMGWREICLSDEPDVIRGQFRMAYEQHARRARENAVLPAAVRAPASALADGVSTPARLDRLGVGM